MSAKIMFINQCPKETLKLNVILQALAICSPSTPLIHDKYHTKTYEAKIKRINQCE